MEKPKTSPDLISQDMLDLTTAITTMVRVINAYQGQLGNNEPVKQQAFALQRRAEIFDKINQSNHD